MRRVLVFALFLVCLLCACDDLNKPMAHPVSPRGPANTMPPDGGAPAAAEGADGAAPPGPAPTITAQPGDIQL